MNDNSGFTLIEMLAMIIILGILVTIGYISIRSVLDRGHDNYYNSQENMLLLAGREYFADYRSKLPKEIGETSTIPAKTLINESYIDSIKDVNKADCDFENSIVTVQKITTRDFQYYVTLICDNYKTDNDDIKPVITFTPSSKLSEDYINVIIKVTDNEEVASFRYVITKDGETYDDSNYNTYNNEIAIKLTEVGDYKIIGYAIDNKGNRTTISSGNYIIN